MFSWPEQSDSYNREDSVGRSRKLDYFPKQCNYSSNDERVSRDDAFRGMAMSAISKGRERGEAHRRKSYYSSSVSVRRVVQCGVKREGREPRGSPPRAHIRIDATQEPTLRINQSKRSIRACDRSETRAILYATLSRGGIEAPVSAVGKWNREFDTVTYLIIRAARGCAHVRMSDEIEENGVMENESLHHSPSKDIWIRSCTTYDMYEIINSPIVTL